METQRTVISLDTNVLLRYILFDDEVQSPVAENLIDNLSSERQGFVSREVILELAWVLSNRYKLDRSSISIVLANLIHSAEFVVEDSASVIDAIAQYEQSSYDLEDLVILCTARRYRALPVHTFDKRLAQHEDVLFLS